MREILGTAHCRNREFTFSALLIEAMIILREQPVKCVKLKEEVAADYWNKAYVTVLQAG